MILPKSLACSRVFGICWSFSQGALIGGAILLVVLTLAVLQVKREYADKVYPGVFLGTTPVSGKTTNELAEFLRQKEDQITGQKVVFLWNNGETKSWEITPSMIDFSLDTQVTTAKLLSFGRRGESLGGFWELYSLLLFPQSVEPKFTYDEEKLIQVTESISETVNKPAKEALFDFKGGRVANFQISQDGSRINTIEAKNLIVLAFSQDEPKDETLNLELPVVTLKPKVSTEQTNDLGIKEVLGEGESFFFDSIPSRIHNIALAASLLHGVVIPPGEVFSFAEKVGEISAKTGYQQAYVIREKKTILEDGGGVCQVSTTLFRAVLNAGLPVVERQAHYYRVSFYEQGGFPPGIDATVYPPSPDFKFKNDTANYILIQANMDKEKKRLSFTFYGTSDGRKVEVEKPIIHSQTPPPEPTYIDDPNLAVGVVKQQDKPHWGAKVSFKTRVWYANGDLKEEREFWSNYTAWPAVYLRGTKTP